MVSLLKNQLRPNCLTSQRPIQSFTPSIYALSHTQTLFRNTNSNHGTFLYILRVSPNCWFASMNCKMCINSNFGTSKRRYQFVVYQYEERHIFFAFANFPWSVAQHLWCCCVKTCVVDIQIMPRYMWSRIYLLVCVLLCSLKMAIRNSRNINEFLSRKKCILFLTYLYIFIY
jgi:hypothetical protein